MPDDKDSPPEPHPNDVPDQSLTSPDTRGIDPLDIPDQSLTSPLIENDD